ncbi:MAG: hypothetical protein HYV15_06000 [Elusimicrobia bacterium]|nr:hypothetical protein [Elusimicrobiota bacterium]
MIRGLLVCALVFAAAAPLRAEEAKPSSVLSWFKNWKNALERSAVEGKYRRMRTSTAVAAVRGAGQSSKDPGAAYWKGGWSDKRIEERMKERGELAAAVGLIFEEKLPEARAALDAFEKGHPQSSFLEEVADARTKLDELEGKTPAPAAAPKTPEAALPRDSARSAEPKEEPAKDEPAKDEAAKAEPAPAAP